MEHANGRRDTGPRLIAILGPYQGGKTTLLEAILFRTGALSRQGKSADKSLAGDASPEARAHAMGVEVNVAGVTYMGDSFTFIDCPGSIEFSSEAQGVLAACDAAIVVCDADEKKAPALQLILRQLDAIGLPRLIFLNKIDRAEVAPRDVLNWMQPASSKRLLLRQLPIWTNNVVTGYVDLALERAYVYRELAESQVIDMPQDVAALEKSERFSLLETLADHDDELMEQLLSDMEPPKDRVFSDLSRDVADGHVTPVLFGSAEHGNGVGRLLKTLRHDVRGVAATAARLKLDAKAAPTAQVLKTFHTAQGGKLSLVRVLAGEIADGATLLGGKGQEARIAGLFAYQGTHQAKAAKAGAGQTVALSRLEGIATGETVSTGKTAPAQLVSLQGRPGVYGLAISVADRKDEVKLTGAVHKLTEEDPALSLTHDHDTGEMVLWGQGEMHLRVAIEKLASRFGVHAQSKPRRIAYKETIRKSVQIRGRHKKQSGGHGQYGDVVVEISPQPRGTGFVFTDTITGGVVPKQYIPAVEAGVREWMGRGPLGFPVVDFSVNLSEGSYHDVDSSEMAFKTAARIAMSEGMPQCGPVLLEPVLAVDIHCPNEATARVNQIVTGHRGQLLGFDGRDGWTGWDTVKAMMPEAEIASLIIELRSATAGVGTFETRFDHMAELTGRAADLAISAAKPA
ncbi:MAG: elongation factor G [Hyphomicrobiales bacterium]